MAERDYELTRIKGTRREKPVSEIDIEKCGFYLPDHARYDYLLNLPEEQDYSLNPGRHVSVVIEEDGKTEEEFVEELLAMNQELGSLNREARKLEKIIHHNVLKLTEGK